MAEPAPTFIDSLVGDWIAGDFEGHFIGNAARVRSPAAESMTSNRRFDVEIVRGVLRNPREAERPAVGEGEAPIRQDRLFPLWIDFGHVDAEGRATGVIEVAVSDIVIVDWRDEHVDDRVSATSGTIRGRMYARLDREAPGAPTSAAPGCLMAFVPMRGRPGCVGVAAGCGGGCALLFVGLFLLLFILVSARSCIGCSGPADVAMMDSVKLRISEVPQVIRDKLSVDNDAHVVSAASAGAEKRLSIDDALDDPDAFFAQCDVPIYQSGDLLFDFGSDELRPEALPQLRKLGRLLRLAKKRDIRIRVQGHTDSAGGDDFNQELSSRRARSVAQWLEDTRSLPGEQIEVEGMGKRKPLVEARSDPALNRLNRRVEIYVACDGAGGTASPERGADL